MTKKKARPSRPVRKLGPPHARAYRTVGLTGVSYSGFVGLQERPTDGNEEALRLLTRLYALANAGRADGTTLGALLGALLMRALDADAEGKYFADVPLTPDQLVEWARSQVRRSSAGIRKPPTLTAARLLLLDAFLNTERVPRKALDDFSSAAGKRLGRPVLGIAPNAARLVASFKKDIGTAAERADASADSLSELAAVLARSFFWVHDMAVERVRAEAMAARLLVVLRNGIASDLDSEDLAEKLASSAARSAGIRSRVVR